MKQKLVWMASRLNNLARIALGFRTAQLSYNSNKDFWDSPETVREYSQKLSIQKPEEAILMELRHQLPRMKILDIGVGAGRTTRFLAIQAKDYIGIDYSANMIRACKLIFRNLKQILFLVEDARNLSFEDNHFDFVLFSFCGIDSLENDEDRLKVLREIRRVTRNGGYLAFSTRNLNSFFYLDSSVLKPAKSIQLFLHAARLLKIRLFYRVAWKEFRKQLTNAPHLILRDDYYDFKATRYFIKPHEQIKQLKDLGFANVRVFGFVSGQEIVDPAKLLTTRDSWLYYLSKVRKP